MLSSSVAAIRNTDIQHPETKAAEAQARTSSPGGRSRPTGAPATAQGEIHRQVGMYITGAKSEDTRCYLQSYSQGGGIYDGEGYGLAFLRSGLFTDP